MSITVGDIVPEDSARLHFEPGLLYGARVIGGFIVGNIHQKSSARFGFAVQILSGAAAVAALVVGLPEGRHKAPLLLGAICVIGFAIGAAVGLTLWTMARLVGPSLGLWTWRWRVAYREGLVWDLLGRDEAVAYRAKWEPTLAAMASRVDNIQPVPLFRLLSHGNRIGRKL